MNVLPEMTNLLERPRPQRTRCAVRLGLFCTSVAAFRSFNPAGSIWRSGPVAAALHLELSPAYCMAAASSCPVRYCARACTRSSHLQQTLGLRGSRPSRTLLAAGAAEAEASAEKDAGDGRFLVSELKVGQAVDGVVKKVLPAGVFVDIGARKKRGCIELGEWLEAGGFPLDYGEAAKAMIGQRISARVVRIRGTDVFLTRRSGSIDRPELRRGQNQKEDIMAFADVSPATWFSGQVVGMAPWGVYVSFREWPAGRVQGPAMPADAAAH
mmetsp:Transcript_31585/g.98222  ORF Transcript_31585/g.98222 Transcript_31585/m.98222 type:complete len:269 (-) Transcript_31585:767-1573(-)